MTLMPVSRISTTGLWSAKPGGSRWMHHFSPSGSCSPPSIISPVTLKSRPRVRSPTGTWMPPPSAVTSISRHSPSLGEIMMQRTMLPPICWATSITHFCSPFCTVSASLMKGSWPSGNKTSTTGPCTSVIIPFIMMFSSFSVLWRRPLPLRSAG